MVDLQRLQQTFIQDFIGDIYRAKFVVLGLSTMNELQLLQVVHTINQSIHPSIDCALEESNESSTYQIAVFVTPPSREITPSPEENVVTNRFVEATKIIVYKKKSLIAIAIIHPRALEDPKHCHKESVVGSKKGELLLRC